MRWQDRHHFTDEYAAEEVLGVSRATYWRWKRGTVPKRHNVEKVLRLTGVDLSRPRRRR
jgi:hypothetical protein